MDLFFEDTNRDEELAATSSRTSKYNRKRCLLDKGTSSTSYSVKVAKVDKDESEDDSYYGGLPPPSVDITETIAAALAMLNKPSLSDQEFDRLLFGKNRTEEEIFEDIKKGQPKHKFITEGIESKHTLNDLVPKSKNQKKKLNEKLRRKTKGEGWFNMKAPEMTEELKNELTVLQMRSALDPKHFYKRSENKTLPKFFEMGKIIESPLDYHNSKNIRQGKKKSIVDELMEDAAFQKFNKKKYAEALVQKQSAGYNKALKKMQRLKKKKNK